MKALYLTVLATACTTTSEFEVTKRSVAPRTGITWLGEPTALTGDDGAKVGAPLPDAPLTGLDMKPAALGTAGKVRVVVTLPSVDTPVCDVQTHLLGETPALAPGVERIAVSEDLPYAMRRFAEESGLSRVTFLSDYREHAFAKAAGLQLARNGLLARSVIVLDGQGVVRHLQIVPEIVQLPDMAKAFAVANQLAR